MYHIKIASIKSIKAINKTTKLWISIYIYMLVANHNSAEEFIFMLSAIKSNFTGPGTLMQTWLKRITNDNNENDQMIMWFS